MEQTPKAKFTASYLDNGYTASSSKPWKALKRLANLLKNDKVKLTSVVTSILDEQSIAETESPRAIAAQAQTKAEKKEAKAAKAAKIGSETGPIYTTEEMAELTGTVKKSKKGKKEESAPETAVEKKLSKKDKKKARDEVKIEKSLTKQAKEAKKKKKAA
jgi:hypothetical protein